jgi:uncharacterized protein YggE
MKTALAVSLLVALVGVTSAQDGTVYTYPPTISVTGYGVAEAEPDMATIVFGADATGVTAAEAVDAAAEMMDGARLAAGRAGVSEDDMTTAYYSLYQEEIYDADYGYTGEFQYHVTESISAIVRDIDDVGAVVGAVVTGGANTVTSITFSVQDIVGLRAEARANAIADAVLRAEQLARGAGVTLDRISSISEYSYDDSNYGYGGGGYYADYSYSMTAAAGESMSAPSIYPAVTKYSTSVSVTYYLAEED